MTDYLSRDTPFAISDEAFRYLSIQQGEINDLSDNREVWDRAYHENIWHTYETIASYLPHRASRVLDIGSGLGGIDVLLNRHYYGELEVCPIDGQSDEPVCNSHASTFNSEKVTRDFLKANGVRMVSYYPPCALPAPSPFELVVSFASWCFHYPPGHYISFVRRCLKPGGTLIVDLRRNKPLWRKTLDARFKYLACAHHGLKFDRLVYTG